jgi:hypothetical protein
MEGDRRSVYLGDGLYVAMDRGDVEIYSHDGIRKTNQVFMDGYVLNAFLNWLEEGGIYFNSNQRW